MARYFATFYAHIGAIRFHRMLTQQGVQAVIMPVPRSVSSSCGSCVRFEAEDVQPFCGGDAERIFLDENGKITPVWSSI